MTSSIALRRSCDSSVPEGPRVHKLVVGLTGWLPRYSRGKVSMIPEISSCGHKVSQLFRTQAGCVRGIPLASSSAPATASFPSRLPRRRQASFPPRLILSSPSQRAELSRRHLSMRSRKSYRPLRSVAVGWVRRPVAQRRGVLALAARPAAWRSERRVSVFLKGQSGFQQRVLFEYSPKPSSLENENSFGPYPVNVDHPFSHTSTTHLLPLDTEGVHLERIQVPRKALVESS